MGAYHLSELTGQPIPILMRISLLIKINHPDQSNPKYYTQRRRFLCKTSWKKPIPFPKYLVLPSSDRPVQVWKAPLLNCSRFARKSICAKTDNTLQHGEPTSPRCYDSSCVVTVFPCLFLFLRLKER